jgi:hypothetical protein
MAKDPGAARLSLRYRSSITMAISPRVPRLKVEKIAALRKQP